MYEYCVVMYIYGQYTFFCQYTYHGQLHTYYNTLQCKSSLSIHKMALKLRNIHVCLKTLLVVFYVESPEGDKYLSSY